MQTIPIGQLTNEQARQWLMVNDPEAAEFWRAIESNDLPRAVADNLKDFRGGQDGVIRVVWNNEPAYTFPVSAYTVDDDDEREKPAARTEG